MASVSVSLRLMLIKSDSVIFRTPFKIYPLARLMTALMSAAVK